MDTSSRRVVASLKPVACDICNKTFSNKSNSRKHKREKHKIVDPVKRSTACREDGCGETFLFIDQLRKHLKCFHGISSATEELSFNSKEEFQRWKEMVEKRDKCFFYKPTGSRKVESVKRSYYYCHRTGTRKPKEEDRKRKKNTLGSCKFGGTCTAGLTVVESERNGATFIDVLFHTTHYGHEQVLRHLPLSKTDKSAIVSQLLEGIPSDVIIEKVRSSVSDSLERIHLLSRKDIHNIRASFGIQGNADSDGKLSVHLWVKEMMEKEDNPVIFYKQQGVQCDTLELGDFALGIMSENQADLLKKFGTDSIICMDTTLTMKADDCGLTTVMVVDDFGEGFPVAFFFSNCDNFNAVKQFCTAISHKTGLIKSRVFMSDDADHFYAAWSSVMEDLPLHLLCSWHVDRAWKDNICVIADKEKQKSVYERLRLVLEETDTEKFHISLNKYMDEFLWDFDTKAFGEQFKTNYGNRPFAWAYCYHVATGVGTVANFEALHKEIKRVYVKEYASKRVDNAVRSLVRLVKDKQIERAIKVEQGKVMSKVEMIQDRHKAALNSSADLIVQMSDNEWIIPSFDTNNDHNHAVKKMSLPTTHSCEVSCKDCRVCTHLYSCTCPDYLLQNLVCKHIHLLGLKFQEDGKLRDVTSTVPDVTSDNLVAQQDMRLGVLEPLTSTQPVQTFTARQKRIVENLQAVLAKVKLLRPETTSIRALESIESHISAINTSADTGQVETRPITTLRVGKRTKRGKKIVLKKIRAPVTNRITVEDCIKVSVKRVGKSGESTRLKGKKPSNNPLQSNIYITYPRPILPKPT